MPRSLSTFGCFVSSASSLALCAPLSAETFGGPGGPIPDIETGGLAFTIHVTEPGLVGIFGGVHIGGLSHTWCGDLRFTLTAPDGTTVSLVDRIGKTDAGAGFGDSSDFGGDYTFADGGSDLWAIAASVPGAGILPSGSYAATGPFSSAAIDLNALLAGRPVAGDWTLTVYDYAGGDVGAFVDWAVSFSIVPGPGGACVAGLLAIAAGTRQRSKAERSPDRRRRA